MKTTVITFNETGAGTCLYTELIDLNQIGRLEVTRATSIEFNNKSQFWEVKNRKGTVLYFSRSRTACLAWENEELNR
jgi:hypothetical protein